MARPHKVVNIPAMKQYTTTAKKQIDVGMTYELTKYGTLLCTNIKGDFKETFEKYGQDAIIQATSRQMITFSEGKDPIQLDREELIKDFLGKYSDNFSRLENVEMLGQGGEAIVFGITPYRPMEVIAKVPLATGENS